MFVGTLWCLELTMNRLCCEHIMWYLCTAYSYKNSSVICIYWICMWDRFVSTSFCIPDVEWYVRISIFLMQGIHCFYDIWRKRKNPVHMSYHIQRTILVGWNNNVHRKEPFSVLVYPSSNLPLVLNIKFETHLAQLFKG